jgi:hypothetical protein
VFREGQPIVKIWGGVLVWVPEKWLPLVKFNKDFLYLPAELKITYHLKTTGILNTDHYDISVVNPQMFYM